MKLRKVINLIIIVTIISLVSVGFATWNFTNDGLLSSSSASGNIEVDKVINSKDYIYLDTTKGDVDPNDTTKYTGIDCFDYCSTGYVVDEILSNYGYVTAYFVLDLTKCQQLYGKTGSISTEIILCYSNYSGNYNIFYDNKNGDSSAESELKECSVSSGNTSLNNAISIGTTSGKAESKFVLPITFTNALSFTSGLYYFSVQYRFYAETNTDSSTYFQDNIYTLFYQDNVEFSLNLKIKKV